MTALPAPKRKSPRPRLAFSSMSAVLAVIATASSLVFVHDWGKGAIPVVEWVCGTSAVLLLLSIIADSRRP
jgi:hypothetical protein